MMVTPGFLNKIVPARGDNGLPPAASSRLTLSYPDPWRNSLPDLVIQIDARGVAKSDYH